MAKIIVRVADADALRAGLDDKNEAGIAPITVGIDSNEQPFLITLIGCYADSEAVLFDSPWQGDRDYGSRINGVWVPKKPHCDECNGMEHGIDDLTFPVWVMDETED